MVGVFYYQSGLLGRFLVDRVRLPIEFLSLIYFSFKQFALEKKKGNTSLVKVLLNQIYFTAVQAIFMTSFVATVVGVVALTQTMQNIGVIGGGGKVVNLILTIISRELGPLIVSLIVIARSGTAVASEIGTMRVNKETQALEVMGINPLTYIVFPRVLGGTLSIFLLNSLFTFVACFVSFLFVRPFVSFPADVYFQLIFESFTSVDIGIFAIKSLACGLVIFAIPCNAGLKVQGSPHEVPQATTAAVVQSIVSVFIIQFGLSAGYYLWVFKSGGLL